MPFFKRSPFFYLMVLLIPTTLLGFLPILSFLIPVEMGEKISLGVTVLLAQIVELLVLSEILPPSSTQDFPIFGRFMICLIFLIVTAIIESVLVNTIYSFSPQDPIPDCVAKIMNSRLAKVLKIRKDRGDDRKGRESSTPTEQNINKSADNCAPGNSGNAKQNNPINQNSTKNIHDGCECGAINGKKNSWHSLSNLIDRVSFIVYLTCFIADLLYLCVSLIV